MPRELRPINPRPLSESEEYQLKQLLDRSGQSLAQAEAQRARDRDQEARLRARQDKLAAEEARLAKRLAQLHVDLDTVTAEIYKLAPSGVSFRFASEGLQKLGEVIPTQSYFNSSRDSMGREQLLLLGEIALSMHERTKPRGRPLREKMQGIKVDIGHDAPAGPGGTSDPRAAMAAAIIAAGRKARGNKE